MKRQGTYGFTFDSKAEEWLHWAIGCIEHNPPKSYWGSESLWLMKHDYAADVWCQYATEARHSPAQQQNAPEIGVTTTRPRNRVLWPLAAGGAVCVTVALVLAKQAGWL